MTDIAQVGPVVNSLGSVFSLQSVELSDMVSTF